MGRIKGILFCFFLFLSIGVKAQLPFNICSDWGGCPDYGGGYTLSFEEDTSVASYFYFDTTASNNLWVIGDPHKLYLNHAYLYLDGGHALITDTINPYPINNYSFFQIKIINHTPTIANGFEFFFHHKIDTDTINDGGTIELSYDNGSTWVNAIEESSGSIFGAIQYTINDTIRSIGKPGFSGRFANLPYDPMSWRTSSFLIYSDQGVTDTVLVRFIFGSDSIYENRDGWMIDNLHVYALSNGISENNENLYISIFPNPTNDILRFNSDKKFNTPFEITVLDITGKIVFETKNVMSNEVLLPSINDGIYFVNFVNENFYSRKKIIIQSSAD